MGANIWSANFDSAFEGKSDGYQKGSDCRMLIIISRTSPTSQLVETSKVIPNQSKFCPFRSGSFVWSILRLFFHRSSASLKVKLWQSHWKKYFKSLQKTLRFKASWNNSHERPWTHKTISDTSQILLADQSTSSFLLLRSPRLHESGRRWETNPKKHPNLQTSTSHCGNLSQLGLKVRQVRNNMESVGAIWLEKATANNVNLMKFVSYLQNPPQNTDLKIGFFKG